MGPRPADRLSGAARNRCQWASWRMLEVSLALTVVGVLLAPAPVALALVAGLLFPGALFVSALGDRLERRRRTLST